MDRAGSGHRIPRAVVAGGADGEAVAGRVQRHRVAELITRLQRRDVDIPAAGIAGADRGFERAAGEIRIGEGEQMDRAVVARRIARAVVAGHANGEAVAGRVQRHRNAEDIAPIQRRHIDIPAARIAGAHGRGQRAAGEKGVGEGEQIDRAGIDRRIARTVVEMRADGEAVAGGVQRHRNAEVIVRLQRRDVDIPAAGIACAERGGQHAAGEVAVGEGEQIDRAGVARRIARAIVARRAYGEAVAGRIQRHRKAELFAHPRLQRGHIDIPAARIALADRGGQRAAGEVGVGEGEQIHRAGIARRIARAVVENSPDGEAVSGRVQRHRCAEVIAPIQRRHVDILAARIAGADRGLQRAAGEIRIGEGEQIDRAGFAHRIARTRIDTRPHGKAVAGGVQRHRCAELIEGVQGGHIHILAAGIAGAERRFEGAAGEIRIGETEQIDRAGIGRRIARTVIAGGADGEAVAGGVQRHRLAEVIERFQRRHIDIAAARIALAERRGQRAAGEIRVGETEQIHRAGIDHRRARTVIENGPDGETVSGGVQRHRFAEPILRPQRRHLAILAAGIAGADGGFQRAAGEGIVGEGEQIDRAGIAHRVARAVIEPRSHGEAVAGRVQRHRLTEEIARLERRDVDIPAAGIAGADGGGQRAAGEIPIGEGEQMDRAGIARPIARPVILPRPDSEAVAGGVQRHRNAEIIVRLQCRHIDIPAARIALAERRFEGAAGEVAVGEGEQIDRAGIARRIVHAVIPDRAHGKAVAGGVQRHRTAEDILHLQGRHVDILAARIALADHSAQGAAGEIRIGEGEQVDRAGTFRRIPEAAFERGPHGEAVAGGVQRHRVAELIAPFQGRDVDILAARIAGADHGFQRAAGEGPVGEGEQIDRAGTAHRIPRAGVTGRPDGEAVAGRVQRHRHAEPIVRLQRRDVDSLAAGIAGADAGFEGAAGEIRIGEGEQMDRAGGVRRIPRAVVGVRADGEAVAGRVQRHRCAEAIPRLQRRHIDILAAGIALAERGSEGAAGEARIGEGEQIDRAGIEHRIARTVIPDRADGEAVAGRVQRHRYAEAIGRLQRRDVDILAARIAGTEGRFQRAAGEARIGEGEQTDRAGAAHRIPRTAIVRRPHGEAVAGRVQRHRRTEPIARLQRRDVDIIAAGIALADRRFEGAAGEARIGEAEQMDRAGEAHRIPRASVAIRPHGEAVAGRVQRHRCAEAIGTVQGDHTHTPVAHAHDAGIGPVGDLRCRADDDVLGVEQQVAAGAHIHIAEVGAAQILRRRNFHRAATRRAARIDAAEEGGQRVGPDDRRPAPPAMGADIDQGRVIDEGRLRTGQRAGILPAADEAVVIGL